MSHQEIGLKSFPQKIPKHEETKPIFYTPPPERTTARTPEYIPSYLEWLWKRSRIINTSTGAVVTSSGTLYTIPTGFIFFLTNACISSSSPSGAASNPTTYLATRAAGGGAETWFIHITLRREVGIPDSGNQSINFNPPLIVEEGQIIFFGISDVGKVSIQGFLMPK